MIVSMFVLFVIGFFLAVIVITLWFDRKQRRELDENTIIGSWHIYQMIVDQSNFEYFVQEYCKREKMSSYPWWREWYLYAHVFHHTCPRGMKQDDIITYAAKIYPYVRRGGKKMKRLIDKNRSYDFPIVVGEVIATVVNNVDL